MLSKSQAKTFFLLGTVICTAVFVGLTVDTFQKIPKQTNQSEMTPEVIRGKHLFDRNNCMGCHTILGEGAYYAPELTKVYSRRGETFIKAMLKDPQAMYPNDRKMVNYHFNDEEISDLTAFFKWIGTLDLNGFPPKPDLIKISAANAGANSSGDQTIVQQENRPMIFNQMCTACHSLNGQGGNVGPALDKVGNKFDQAYITRWLQNPLAVKADSRMPKLPLTEKDITELSVFLANLK